MDAPHWSLVEDLVVMSLYEKGIKPPTKRQLQLEVIGGYAFCFATKAQMSVRGKPNPTASLLYSLALAAKRLPATHLYGSVSNSANSYCGRLTLKEAQDSYR